jgi:dUTP pyrophosphatase
MLRESYMKIKLDKGAIAPTRAHTWDAGLDLYATVDCVIGIGNRHTFDTGVHVQIPEGFVGFIKSKSGLMVKNGMITDGTIDAHYTGPIKVCLFNNGLYEYPVHAGDKIAQLVIMPCMLPKLELVDSLEETDRGDNGFGSTGR